MSFIDRRWGPRHADPRQFGDPILVRRDGLVSYNLAVVADDIDDGVNDVVRGSDLLEYTAVQMQLWSALGAAPPRWLHTPLVLGADGRKLSKSHGSAHVGAMRDAGATPADVWRIVLPWLGIAGATSLAEAAAAVGATGSANSAPSSSTCLRVAGPCGRATAISRVPPRPRG